MRGVAGVYRRAKRDAEAREALLLGQELDTGSKLVAMGHGRVSASEAQEAA